MSQRSRATDDGPAPPPPLSLLATARVVHAAAWPYLRDFRLRVVALFALSIFSSLADAAGLGFALVFAVLVFREGPEAEFDAGALTEFLQSLFGMADPATIAAILFAVISLRIAADGLHTVLTTTLDAEIGYRVRLRVLHGQLFMPQVELERYAYGELTTLLNEHCWSVADAFDAVTNMAKAACAALVLSVLVIAFSWYTALVAAAGIALTTLLTDRLRQASERVAHEHTERAERVSARTLRVLQAIRSIRVFGRERDYYEKFRRDSEEERDLSVRAEHISNAIEPISHFFSLATLACVAALAVWLEGSYQPAVAAMAILYRMYPFVTELLSDRVQLASLVPHLRAVTAFVRHSDQRVDNGDKVFTGLRRGIDLRDVSFAYPAQTPPCLEAVTAHIAPHGWTALEGASGAGKSTLIGILLGTLTPNAGAVLLDDVPLSQFDIWSWRKHVAVAGQDIELIDGSVGDNISLGNPQATRAQIEEAARWAQASAFIEALPAGYDTWVGERGISLSGGQRQRVGIARALLRDPILLILDEATSALDRDVEAAVIANVERVMRGRAVLVVAHHLPEEMPITARIRIQNGRGAACDA